jgi:uncharacterized protein
MKHLCDSNVFLALACEQHANHEAAVAWLESQPKDTSFHFCRATQTTFLRLLTVPEWMKENVRTNEEAIAAYRELRNDSRIGLVQSEPPEIERLWFEYAGIAKPASKRWLDAYLAAFARAAKMSFATFDRGFTAFPDLELFVLKP